MLTNGKLDGGEPARALAVAAALEHRMMVSYAVISDSRVRRSEHPGSDLDVAIGLQPGVALDTAALGSLIADLEAETGLPVDVILLDEAPPALAFRVFREGRPVLIRDRGLFVARKARAILEYLDFRRCEELCAQGVLRAAARG